MPVGTRDHDRPILKRLAQAVEDLGREFGKFIQEKDTVVGEGNLTGTGTYAAADESSHGCRMVRRAEGPLA